MKGLARVAFQPGADFRMLVGGVVIDDCLDPFVAGDVAFDGVEEADELLMAMALHAAANHGAIEHVERREQGGGAVPDVVVGHGAAAAFLHRQSSLRTALKARLIPSLLDHDSLGDSRNGWDVIQAGKRTRFAMPIALRPDFDSACVRALARRSKDAAQTRRLLALAAIYDGASRTEAAAIGGVTLQIVRDWVLKFNADGADGLIDRKAPGPEPKLMAEHRAALAAIIHSGPTPAIHGVVRWRLIDLFQWIWEEFRISIAKPTMSRELRAMGYRKLSARPRHHAQAEGAAEDFKKVSLPIWKPLPARRALRPPT